jgi:phenylacetate-coenzyme A ligase PaaK-like adenylate-forming protein
MNWRHLTYFSYASLRGYRFPAFLSEYRREWQRGHTGQAGLSALSKLLLHCRKSVPYYADLLEETREDHCNSHDPRQELLRLPVLRKETIRASFEKLQSEDLHRRHWAYNTSGGSTGEPVRLIQDAEYRDRSTAISYFYFWLLGYGVGQPLVRLWGSERDIQEGTRSPKARLFGWLTNSTWINAFQMSPERMRQSVATLNRLRPRLILAYAQAAYELARFVEREKLPLEPQRAVVTSAGTLHPFMRETIARVFGCKVYNFYGSREVSDIAGEVPGTEGLWVAPWGNYVEILDDREMPVPPGEEGNIVVTSLTNYAMPLLRYWIGDRGTLMPSESSNGAGVQVLKHVSGRNVDVFRTRDETMVDGEYFTHLLYHRPWVWKFQVIQKSYEEVLFRVVRTSLQPPKAELEDIASKVRLVMGEGCRIDFEFPEELPPHASGKYRYTISEVGG